MSDSMRTAVDEDRGSRSVWVAAAAGALAYAIAFYPGAMSFDSAYQWWQARGGETTNIHGVGMTWLWRVDNMLAPGPGALFVLQLLLYWGGLALIARRLSAPTVGRVAFMLVVAVAPVCFVLLSHVWSDVMLMAVLTFAVGIMLLDCGGHRLWLLVPWALLLLAVTLRHNAAAAVFPLLVYLEHLRNGAARPLRTLGSALLMAVLFQFASVLLDRTVDQPLTLFAVTAEWDLAAISLDDGAMLLPPASHGPGLTLDDLRQAFAPYSAGTLFERTRAGMRQPFFAPADPLNDELRHAWIEAVIAHPRAYLAHRWRLTKALFGSKSRDWPRSLVYVDGFYQYDGNPPVAPNTSSAHAWCLQLFDAMYASVWLSAWPYLCLTLVALALAWRRRHQVDMGPAFAVLASGALYAAPLLFIAPSAELRYTGWSCLAALIGAALALAPPRFARLKPATVLDTRS